MKQRRKRVKKFNSTMEQYDRRVVLNDDNRDIEIAVSNCLE